MELLRINGILAMDYLGNFTNLSNLWGDFLLDSRFIGEDFLL